jgi:hypothetical protein
MSKLLKNYCLKNFFLHECWKFNNNNNKNNILRQPNPNVKNAPGKEEVKDFWREIYEKKSHIMKKRAG